jgi:ribonuclease HI
VLRCYTDSTYVTTVADPSCRAKANADLVATLRELICTHPVVWHWIRGHNGDVGNTLADTAARKAMECHAPTLTIPLPSDTPLPSPRELTDLIRVSLGRR